LGLIARGCVWVLGLFAPCVLLAQGASAPVPMNGFGVQYTMPAGWTLSGMEGRIHAWTDAEQRQALVLYAGHFAPLELALGDAQRVLGVPRDEDTKVIAPLAAARFGDRRGLAGSLRVTGDRAVLAHVAVMQFSDSTVLGAVAVLEAAAGISALDSAAAVVATVLAAAASTPESMDAARADMALQDRLTAHWEAQQVSTSSSTGGSYSNEESWTFSSDGRYAYRKRFSVTVPGADVAPEVRDEHGRWYTVGGALVLVSTEGRLTVDVQFADGVLLLDGTRFRAP
jgi:Ni/Co efflux regulator RcnB